MLELINFTIDRLFHITPLWQKRVPQVPPVPDRSRDPVIESLGFDQTMTLLPQVMTLARRRSCAAEQIGQLAFAQEDEIANLLTNWYLRDEWKKTVLSEIMRNDLDSLFDPEPHPTSTLQKRVLLSNTGRKIVDAYNYGPINPFQFNTRGRTVNLTATLADKLDFPARIKTIRSFDSEPKGHKHQIRYFKALFTSYALADNLEKQQMGNDQTRTLQNDRNAFAAGWITFAEKVRTLEIDPYMLSPDDDLLYSPEKVQESAYLFETYDYIFHRYLAARHIAFR